MSKKKTTSKKINGLIELKEIPERFIKLLPENKKLFLLKSNKSMPEKIPGYEFYGLGKDGFYYIN